MSKLPPTAFFDAVYASAVIHHFGVPMVEGGTRIAEPERTVHRVSDLTMSRRWAVNRFSAPSAVGSTSVVSIASWVSSNLAMDTTVSAQRHC
jgi:hypothetical protein